MWDGADNWRARNTASRTLTLMGLAVFDSAFAASESAGTQSNLPPAPVAAIHATRLDYSELEVPEAVTVITQDDIRRAGYVEISEIFRSVPGFRIVKIGDESRVSYHGTIVSQNRRMLITIDGRSVLVGDSQYIEFDRLPVEIEDVERVTVTRGPNGAAYGDNAFLASVDIKTTGRDAPLGASVRVGAGHNDWRKAAASLNEEVGKYDIQLSAADEHDGGYDYYDSFKTPRDDGKTIKRARLAIDRESDGGSRWRLDGSFYDSENKTGIQLLKFSGEQQNDGRFIALSHEQEFGESSRLDWFISHNRQSERLRQGGCYTPDAIAGAMALVSDPSLRAGLLAPTLFVPRVLGVPLEDTCFFIDLGIDSRRSELEVEFESRQGPWRYLLGGSATQVDASSPQRFAGFDQRQRSYRVFGETAITMGQLHTSLGVMVQDSSNVEDMEFAGRAALNWLFQPSQALRYSYAHSFRIPSLVETETLWTGAFRFGRRADPPSAYQISVPLPFVTSATPLVPETIDSHSIGYFGAFLGSSMTVDIKVFREKISDRVEADLFYFSPPPFNDGSFTLSGAETEVTMRVNDQWRVSGHYSYLDTNARAAFERGMYGKQAGSFSATFRPFPGHELTAAYYGNSAISRNAYDRYDLVYNYDRRVGEKLFRSQVVLQHHVGGVDGIRGIAPLQTNEGHFKHLNQVFINLELTF